MRTSTPFSRKTTTTTTSASHHNEQNNEQQQQQQHWRLDPNTNQNQGNSTKKNKRTHHGNVTVEKMTPYVIQGIYYLLRHKVLWKTVAWPMVWTLVFVVCCLCILLPLAFVPQAIAMSAIMSPFLGVPLALVLVLLELLLLLLIFSAVFLLPITDNLFDQVLILKGHQALVDQPNSSCCGCCSVITLLKLGTSLITLPLNLIPVAGTVLWLFVNGRYYAWDAHSHYFYELKHCSFQAQTKLTRKRWYAYHMFGMEAMALELIPFANVLFVFSNCVGAALWACALEDQEAKEKLISAEEGAAEHGSTHTATSGSNNPEPGAKLSYPTEETPLGGDNRRQSQYEPPNDKSKAAAVLQ